MKKGNLTKEQLEELTEHARKHILEKAEQANGGPLKKKDKEDGSK